MSTDRSFAKVGPVQLPGIPSKAEKKLPSTGTAAVASTASILSNKENFKRKPGDTCEEITDLADTLKGFDTTNEESNACAEPALFFEYKNGPNTGTLSSLKPAEPRFYRLLL